MLANRVDDRVVSRWRLMRCEQLSLQLLLLLLLYVTLHHVHRLSLQMLYGFVRTAASYDFA